MSEQRKPRPASSKRSEAARANGAKSRGPVSDAGKSRSSQNALKHGAYADSNANPVLICNEAQRAPSAPPNWPETRQLPPRTAAPFCACSSKDAGIWQGLINDFNAEFQPVGVAEHGLVEEMAAAHLRIRRYWLAEAATLNIEMARQAPDIETKYVSITEPQRVSLAVDHFTLSGQPHSQTLGFYHRLESRLRRLYSRALSDLIKVQHLRAQREASAAPPEPALKIDGTNPPLQQVPPPLPVAAGSTRPIAASLPIHPPTTATSEPEKRPATPSNIIHNHLHPASVEIRGGLS